MTCDDNRVFSKEEEAKATTEDNSHEHETIVVHGDKHDNVRRAELDGEEDSADELLLPGRTEGKYTRRVRVRRFEISTPPCALSLSNQTAVILSHNPTRPLDEGDEEEEADNRGSKYTLGANVPVGTNEARIDDKPVP